MKNKLISLVVGILASFSIYGQSAISNFTTNNMAASATQVITTAAIIDSMVLQTTNASGGIVRLYDGAITNVSGAYTNVTAYSTNKVTTYVTTTGVTNTFTNTVWYYNRYLVAAATNNSPAQYTIIVPGNNAIVSADVSLIFGTGVTLSNSAAGLNATVYYRKP